MPARCLVIAGQELEDAFRQVKVAPVGSSQVGMPLRVVQEQESASTQHFARAPNKATWKQVIAVNRLAVPIHVRSAGGGQSGSDLWTDQSWQVQAARASVKISCPPARATWERKRSTWQNP